MFKFNFPVTVTEDINYSHATSVELTEMWGRYPNPIDNERMQTIGVALGRTVIANFPDPSMEVVASVVGYLSEGWEEFEDLHSAFLEGAIDGGIEELVAEGVATERKDYWQRYFFGDDTE